MNADVDAHPGTDASCETNDRPDLRRSASASRAIVLPKLQRQISLVMSRTTSQDGSPTPPAVPAISPEEQIKVQRYERMMDRFQLRHVPVTRTASSGSIRAVSSRSQREAPRKDSGARPPSRRPSAEHPSIATGEGVDTARNRSKRMSGTIYAAASDPDGNAQSRHPSSQVPSARQSISQYTATPSTQRTQQLTPCLPTSICTRGRLVVLVGVFAAQLVYMPYGIVYYPPDRPTTIALNSIVDSVFLLNILATCNTAVWTSRGHLVTSRRAIWRQYRKSGLTMDVLSCVPVELVARAMQHESQLQWVLHSVHILVQSLCLQRHLNCFYSAWKQEAIRADKSLIAWILYSRYGHLVRILGIVILITLAAHYFACIWSSLLAEVDPLFVVANAPFATHVHSIYDALQLLQGQGLPTTTPAQDVFCSIAVLLGSIVLAVIFGHVAILVSNFSANQTSYQRKMERVFAVMGKLQLPHPIRERVHQYYEHLHAEYESLDGEIVQFAKDLSHTLELEVVLFKYMDVVMHVPHWHECSPDFQKQLVLNLRVRVYLPDDFIMRRGEVGTECFMVSRGTCKQHEYATGNYEPPTIPLISHAAGAVPTRNRRQRSAQFSSQHSVSPRPSGTGTVLPRSRYSVVDSGRSDVDARGDSRYSSVTEIKRGQSIGAMSLLANYERSSDLRAVTYVEMCVLERETFQRILTRYAPDREIVITSIVHHTMLHLAAERAPCMLMQMVQSVVPDATTSAGIRMVAKAMNPRESDPTIVFGVTEQLSSRLRAIAGSDVGDDVAIAPPAWIPSVEPAAPRHDPAHEGSSVHHTSRPSRGTPSTDTELLRMAHEMNTRLTRMEERGHTKPCCRCSHRETPSATSLSTIPTGRPRTHSSRASHTLTRRHTIKAREARAIRAHQKSNVSCAMETARITVPVGGETATVAIKHLDRSLALSAPKRVLKELVDSLWSRSTDLTLQHPPEQPSPSPWADQLYQAKRDPPLHPPHGNDPCGRRPSLRRTLST